MALTTTDQVRAFLRVADADTAMTAWIDALRPAAEAEIKSYLGRDLEAGNYVEFYSGNGQRKLALNQRPVTAVNNVWLNFQGYYGTNPASLFDSSSILSPGVDYVAELDWVPPWQSIPVSKSGNLIRLHWVWAEMDRTYYPGKLSTDIGPSFGNIKVDYNAGYPSGQIPADIQLAVAMLVSTWRRILPAGGWLIEEKIGDYLYKLDSLRHVQGQYPELGTLFAILNRYKEVAF